MGNCVTSTSEEREAKSRAAATDHQLRLEQSNVVKTLLLGENISTNVIL